MASIDTGFYSERVLLSTAYLPNLDYVRLLLSGKSVFIEQHEHFTKQSYRNRCTILGANGALDLSIPLVRQHDKEMISEKKISYQERWQNQHWRTITSAYKNSAYFEYFEDELKGFYGQEYELLFDYNWQLMQTILKILRQSPSLKFTESYERDPVDALDARPLIHPKKKALFGYKPYYQVFADKHGFVPNLSILDLLFNEGLNSLAYLQTV